MDVPTLKQRFAETVQLQRTDDSLIINVALIRKNISIPKSNLEAVSLNERITVDKDQLITEKPRVVEGKNYLNEIQLARIAKEGYRPIVVEKFGGYETRVQFVKEPPAPKPYFVIIHEYKTCNYLGDYGAGKMVKSFYLMPGERTNITVKTYKEMNSTRSYSENVIDSFSESSTNELEKIIESESGEKIDETESGSSTNSESSGFNIGGSLSAMIPDILSIGINGGYNESDSGSDTNTTSATLSSNMRSLSKAIEKHIAISNANRTINVNNTTTDTYKEGEETSTVRDVENYNKSRVLNFAFRQLNQQYISLTTLSNIKVAYCNGYKESLQIVNLEELDALLARTIKPDHIDKVRIQILKNYCTIYNYEDEPIEYIEKVTRKVGACLGLTEQETFYRVKKKQKDTYEANPDGLVITTNAPILNVQLHTLQTSSMVVDAYLGNGEALDCYNMRIQDADAVKVQLQNLVTAQQLNTIEEISDPVARADAYHKVFQKCCEVAPKVNDITPTHNL